MSEPPEQPPQSQPPENNNTIEGDVRGHGYIREQQFPEQFQNYPVTFLSSLGRADLAGASAEEQQNLRTNMYDGWMRPNEYDDRGNLIFGPNERREARERYQDEAAAIEDRYAGDVNTEFDWQAWQEEYEEGSLTR